ncbi:MAG TPA: hypothetical protein VGQ42_13965 [Candidatus Dormibacteraeota bacterium]|nr:hypothetical protein [Candidatus Dormibacteraeota bacterium]
MASPTVRQAARHGMRSAVQAICLVAGTMAAAGAVGASRAPVELTAPAQSSGASVVVQVTSGLPQTVQAR